MPPKINKRQTKPVSIEVKRGRPKGSKKKTGNNTILNKSKSRANKRQVGNNKITPPRNKTSSVARKNKNLDEDEDYSQENEENINEEELLENLSDMNYEEDHNSEDSLEIVSPERGSEVRSRHEAIPPSRTPERSSEVRSRHEAIPPSRTPERSSEVRSRHEAIPPSRTPERSSEVRSRHEAIPPSRTPERSSEVRSKHVPPSRTPERGSEVRSRHEAIPPSRTPERSSEVRSRYEAIPPSRTPERSSEVRSRHVPPSRTPERSSVVRSRPLSQTERSSTPSSSDASLPASLSEMSNLLDICNWLVKRPQILELANQMVAANNTSSSANTIANYVPGISNNSPVLTETGENKSRLWDEESKCLFLRIRNPSSSVLDSFILAVFGYQPCSEKAKAVFQETRKRLGDFRNKFNATLRGLASELKESRRIENINTITMPSQNIIEEFISEEVVIRKVLARYFVTTNETELRRNGSLDRLVRFVREAFKIHYKDSNKEKIKDLDVMTKDLVIPSRSGYNLASSLTVH
ncbi:hypothetical protein RirG_224740 [Rhizophagus irregularis DAOM 197198w]|uniref:Uncharacterized protein n=1 Tax=Rhizophagus irregularis (strain DAOM 197198w) TaxID=1432141 RepID=A0A015IMV0_RHIIW|nr:hypothetical protein RirG_224740 [Rhizophagus irregularis DAOM 197198w]